MQQLVSLRALRNVLTQRTQRKTLRCVRCVVKETAPKQVEQVAEYISIK